MEKGDGKNEMNEYFFSSDVYLQKIHFHVRMKKKISNYAEGEDEPGIIKPSAVNAHLFQHSCLFSYSILVKTRNDSFFHSTAFFNFKS